MGDMPRWIWFVSLAALTLACGALAQDTRAGMRVQFVTLHSAGGMRGEAFLPISSRRVEASERASSGPCTGRATVSFEGRHPSAYVRSVRVTLHGDGSAFEIEAAGCPTASVRATLKDGTLVDGGAGEVRITSRTARELHGSLDWTPSVEGEPFPLKATFAAKLPAPKK